MTQKVNEMEQRGQRGLSFSKNSGEKNPNLRENGHLRWDNISFLWSMYLVSYILSYFSANTSALETKISELTYKTEKYKQNDILKSKKFKVNVADLKDFIRDKKETLNRTSDTLGFSRCMYIIYWFTMGVKYTYSYSSSSAQFSTSPNFYSPYFLMKKKFRLKSERENLPQM